ncbi:MAG: DNA polymerase III subunit beta [Anaerolineales bacterium]|uniref:DNA polymerase III subunit beta n=1 Tax=Candidatus Desulfolinea nitratireducens TaxID=2841698 RepID=A0A8J6NGP1_9CHLR|nr:DNA polymerase III subunit beta [Candidatus Desulfolinea nitratireducens]
MKASLLCKRTDLREAVEQLMPAISARAPMIVLLHIAVEIDPNQNMLHLSSTDLEVRISTSIPAQITLETDTPESFLIPAQIFSDLIAIMEGEQVRLVVDGHSLLVQTGATKTRISLLAEDEFPPAFEMAIGLPSIALSSTLFKSALQRVIIAASSDETRINLNSVQVCALAEGALRLAATDGFRLATEIITFQSETEEESEFLLPLNVAKKLLRVLPDDEDSQLLIKADGSRALFSWGNMRYWGLLLQNQYPDWERLIYGDDGKNLESNAQEFERDALQMAVKRAEIFARDAQVAHLVHFKPTQSGMQVSGESTQTGQSEEEIACPISIPFALNGLFALQGLSVLKSPRPKLLLTGSHKPVIFSEGDFVYMVMPLASAEENTVVTEAPVSVDAEPVPA